MIKSMIISVAIAVLKRVARHVWDALWLVVEEAVGQAEDEWNKTGTGEVKMEWVLDKVITFLEQNTKLNWFTRMAIKIAIGHIVSSVIEDLNDSFGHDWRAKIINLKTYLERFIPIL